MQLKNRISSLRNDYVLRSFISSAFSFGSTAVFLVYNFIIGVSGHMIWNFSISFYYLVLVILRAVILLRERKWRGLEDEPKQQKRLLLYRRTCLMMILMDLALVVPITLMELSQRSVSIGTIPAIAAAAYTTYKVVLSILNYKKTRKEENYSLLGLRIINLKDAVVSVLTLQNTLIMVFSTEEDMLSLTSVTSAVLLAATIGFTVFSLIKSHKQGA